MKLINMLTQLIGEKVHNKTTVEMCLCVCVEVIINATL